MKLRVLLADDHILFAQAIARLLAPVFDVVDIAADGRALQALARKHKPDVIVADIMMPLMSGLESIRSLRRDSYMPRVVFLTMHADTELARECFNCGGSAFVCKEFGYDELVTAITMVMANHQYLSPNIAIRLTDPIGSADGACPSELQKLSPRQREILQLFAEGKTTKEIASITNLSTRTVEWHKYRMMRVLNVRRAAELVQHAIRMKLVS